MKILLIEDNADDMFFVKRLLRGNDFVEAGTLQQGLAYIAANGSIDLVLLDLGLPDSSGATTFVTLCERKLKIPVIVLSGSAFDETVTAAIRAGIDDFLPKDQLSAPLLNLAIAKAQARRAAHV